MRASSLVLALLAGAGCRRSALESDAADAAAVGTPPDGSPADEGMRSDGPPAAGDAPSQNTDATPAYDGPVPSADANCGVLTYQKIFVPPDMLVVLDRSISVDPTTWNNFLSAIVATISKDDASVDWGLYTFAQDGPACGAGTVSTTIDVPIAAYDSANVIAHIGAAGTDASGTPTAAAIQTAAAYMLTLTDQYPKFLLLVTDGAPTCAGTIDALSSDPAQAQADAIAAIAAADAAGIPTLVLAPSTTTNPADVAALNALAGATRFGRGPQSPKYYTELTVNESLTLLDEGTSCTFFLGASTPPAPDDVAVTLNGTTIPRDPSHMRGWDYADARATAIMLYGAWCDMVTSSRSDRIDIYFGCPNTSL